MSLSLDETLQFLCVLFSSVAFPEERFISNVSLLWWGDAPFPDTLISAIVFASLMGGNAGQMMGLRVLIPDVANLGASISETACNVSRDGPLL